MLWIAIRELKTLRLMDTRVFTGKLSAALNLILDKDRSHLTSKMATCAPSKFLKMPELAQERWCSVIHIQVTVTKDMVALLRGCPLQDKASTRPF